MKSNCILSLTLSGHGFSGAVCLNGDIAAATSLERLTRIKNDILLPFSKADLDTLGWAQNPKIYQENIDLPFDLNTNAIANFEDIPNFRRLIDYLLDASGVTLRQVDCVVYGYRHNRSAKAYFEKHCPDAIFLAPDEHHFIHACQAFLPSKFEEAAILVVDGQGVPLQRTGGDQLSGCLAYGKGNSIELLSDLPVKHSLGGLYAVFTKKIGFKTNEEGKTMGLAPYGSDKIYNLLRKDLRFDTSEFDIRRFSELMKRWFKPKDILYALPRYGAFLNDYRTRQKNDPFTDQEKDLAYAVQKITEDVMVHLANVLYEATGSKNLCIAGGVGLNCVANYQVLIRSKFENIFIHPNPGDNGMAVGQALYAYTIVGNQKRKYVATTDSLGKSYTEQDITTSVEMFAAKHDLDVTKFDSLNPMYEEMARYIAAGNITSWFQGRSEFGPRALGNRSILADPRRKDMKDILNSRVKFREDFRPFTPSVLANRYQDYFELNQESPFMLLAAYVKPGIGAKVPAITHADNTARVQTVSRDVNERYYDLIAAFERVTGVAMILDTSFNVAGEPIVESPTDALKCFLSTDIDVLCIDRYIVKKRGRTLKVGVSL